MSIVVETFLMCDICYQNFGVDNRNASGKEQRKNARNEGWIFSGGKDKCDVCKTGKVKQIPSNLPKYWQDHQNEIESRNQKKP